MGRDCCGVPLPGIPEGSNLCRSADPRFLLKENVIVRFGVKRRVKVNEIHRIVCDFLTQHREVVAEKQQVLAHGAAVRGLVSVPPPAYPDQQLYGEPTT